MEEIVKVLLQSGLLGAVTLIALLAARKLYLDLANSRKAFDERIDKLHTEHKAEMKALEERYITKAETWMQQYHDLAKTLAEIADAQERRYGR